MSYAFLIAKNAGAKFIATAMNMGASGVFVIIATRYLGDIEYGKLTLALSFTAIFNVLSDLGMNILAVKEVAQNLSRCRDYVGTLFCIRFILGMGVFVATGVSLYLFGYSSDVRNITLIVAFGSFFNALHLSIVWVFQAFQKLEYDALFDGLKGFLTIALCWLTLELGHGVFGVSWVMAFVSIVIFFVSLLLAKKHIASLILRVNIGVVREMIRAGYPMAVMVIFATIYANFGIVMLSWFAEENALGWYGAANKVVGVMNSIPVILIPTLFPVLAESYSNSRDVFTKLLAKCFKVFIILGLGIVIPLSVLSSLIVEFLFGPQFINSSPILKILSWTWLAILLKMIIAYGLIGAGFQRVIPYIYAIGLGINLAANVFLTPNYKQLGVAWSFLLTEWVIFLLTFIVAWRSKILKWNITLALKFSFAFLAYFFAFRLYPSFELSYVFPMAIGCYFAAMVACRLLTRGDLVAMKTVLRYIWRRVVGLCGN